MCRFLTCGTCLNHYGLTDLLGVGAVTNMYAIVELPGRRRCRDPAMTGQNARRDVPGLVVVRGAGDIATGVIQKIVRAGFMVVALEVTNPSAIRWRAALCPAVTLGCWRVEDLTAVRAADWEAARGLLEAWAGPGYLVPVLVDPDAELLTSVRPLAVVDAILAKRNLGTHRAMAPVTIGCGPGFSAGDDVDLVVETMRGHQLGEVITRGPAQPNTGVPGVIAGRAAEQGGARPCRRRGRCCTPSAKSSANPTSSPECTRVTPPWTSRPACPAWFEA